MLSVANYFKSLTRIFEQHAIPDQVDPMRRYMKNRFDFYGLKSPARKLIIKDYVKENGIPEGEKLQQLVELMWDHPKREMQYTALDLMEKRLRKLDISFLPFFEKLILKKSWWDTVDWLAPKGVGTLLQKYPEQIIHYPDSWNRSENIWLQRSTILFQLKYKDCTDFELLKKYIVNTAESKEFFVRKGAGWALREYAKTAPQLVSEFVNQHKNDLSGLTIREALKHF